MEEEYYTNPSEWRKDLSYNVYMPMACDDVLALQRFDQLLKQYGIHGYVERRDAPTQLFFGNHPIKWVCIFGRVVSVESRESNAICVFSVTDGLGPNALLCVEKSPNFNAAARVKVGDVVGVYGEVRLFAGDIQVIAKKLLSFSPLAPLRYYAFRELIIQVRKHILERSAEEFKLAARPCTIPKQTILELEAAEVSGLRAATHNKCLEWGIPLEKVIANTLWSYPEN